MSSSQVYTPRGNKSPRRASPYKSSSRRSGNGLEVLNASAIPNDDEGGMLGSHVDPNTSQAMQLYQSARGSDLRSLLLNTEKEVAELRDECSLRGTEVETLKAALQREHEAALRAQTRYQSDLDEMRAEYDRQQSRLIEQITVLKGVSESALLDKNRNAEEANQRKQQLLQLLERERDEKSQLMADYRQQTESLIAEQGREITGLRNLLEASRNEEEKLLVTITNHEERRNELEEQLLKAESALADERVNAQKRIREIDTRLTQQMDQLRAKHDEEEQSFRHDILKLSNQKEALEDQARSLSERLKLAEANHETERRGMRESYDADVVALQEEIKVLKDQRDKADANHRKELERLTKGDESLMQSLRKTIETLRQEKQQQAEEHRSARDTIVSENNTKVLQLNQTIESLRRESSEERSVRKEAEAAKQSAVIRVDSLQSQVNRLTAELEHNQVEARTRERAVEQDHNQLVDHLRTQIRNLESEGSALRQQLKKVDLEVQRLVDDCDSKQSLIDSMKVDHQRTVDGLKAANEQQSSHSEQQRQQQSRSIDVLHAQKVQLEAESGRLLRNLSEVESRYNAAVKQLGDERRALEASINENQALKNIIGEQKQAAEAQGMQLQETEEALQEKRKLVDDLRAAIDTLENALRDSRRSVEQLRDELSKLSHDHEERLDEVRTKGRHQAESLENQVEALREELRIAKETQFSLEGDVRHSRDEASRWQRESIAKDEEHNELLRQIRTQEEDELSRMDGIINSLRDDLSKAQIARAQSQREISESQRDAERRVAVIQEALDAERSSKHRLHEEIRNKEQLAAELQGTVRLLSSRLQSKEEDVRRLDAELNDTSNRVHDAHSVIGKKDAIIGQLNARLRVFESRGSL